jgi:Zn-dependent alcohol dehydrogenase
MSFPTSEGQSNIASGQRKHTFYLSTTALLPLIANTHHSTHSGVCHSDMGVMMNSWSILPFPTQAGQVGGHEGVGKIVKMGPGTDSAAVKVGDRVGIKWMAGICESCEACRAGMDACCSSGVSSTSNSSQPLQDGGGDGERENHTY